MSEPSDTELTAEAKRRWPAPITGKQDGSAHTVRRLAFLQGALWMRASSTLRDAAEVTADRWWNTDEQRWEYPE